MTGQHPSNDNADGFRPIRSGRAPAYRCMVCGDIHSGRTIAWRCHCGNVRLVSGFYIARFGDHTVQPLNEIHESPSKRGVNARGEAWKGGAFRKVAAPCSHDASALPNRSGLADREGPFSGADAIRPDHGGAVDSGGAPQVSLSSEPPSHGRNLIGRDGPVHLNSPRVFQ